jgi:hypothetical protein
MPNVRARLTGTADTVTLSLADYAALKRAGKATALGWVGEEDFDLGPDTHLEVAAVAHARTARVVAVTGNTYVAGTATDRTALGTSRRPHTLAVAVSDLRFGYANVVNNGNGAAPNYADVDPATAGAATPIVIRASVELPSGTIYRLTFGGRTDVTIDPGGYVESDPLPVDLAAGAVIYSRTFLVSGTWHYNAFTGTSTTAGQQGGWVATTDLTAPGAAAIAHTANSVLFVPAVIVGRPADPAPAVFLAGDSIGNGVGDAPGTTGYQGRSVGFPQLAGGGFVARALHGLAGIVNATVPGDNVQLFVAMSGHFRRLPFTRYATTFLCQYGRNDISGGRTFAQVAGDLLAAWTLGANRGLKVIQTTITPKGTSADGWRTVAGQTADASTPVLGAVNDWLRAGAPLDPTTRTPVAPGAVARPLLKGQLGHPLGEVFHIAGLVESAQNAGTFKAADNVRSFADGVTTAASSVLTVASGNFTTADLGRNVTVAGAGAAGALLVATVLAVNSATSVTLSTAATTAVTGAAVYVFDAYSVDGTHLSPYGASVAAGGVVVSSLV